MYHHFCQLLADVCHDGKRHSGGGCRQGGMHWHSSLAVLVGFFLICDVFRNLAPREHHSPGLFSLDRHAAKLVLLEMFLCPDTRESGIAGLHPADVGTSMDRTNDVWSSLCPRFIHQRPIQTWAFGKGWLLLATAGPTLRAGFAATFETVLPDVAELFLAAHFCNVSKYSTGLATML